MAGYITLTDTITAPNSLSAGVQLGEPKDKVYVLVASLTTTSILEVYGSNDGTTYTRVYHPPVNSATVAANPFQIPAAVTSGWVQIPGDFPYIKLHQTSAASSSASYTILCKA